MTRDDLPLFVTANPHVREEELERPSFRHRNGNHVGRRGSFPAPDAAHDCHIAEKLDFQDANLSARPRKPQSVAKIECAIGHWVIRC